MKQKDERHVARTVGIRIAYTLFVGKLRGKYRLESLGLNGRINLKWILNYFGVRVWTVLNQDRMVSSGGGL
jgi:hypothetical protein